MKSIQSVLSDNGSSMPSLAAAMSTETGFDRENMDEGGKSTGILQYCHSASSGEIHNVGSDESGIYSLLTGQTHFADGTALVDRSLMQFRDTGEDDFRYWRHGEIVIHTDAKFIQLATDFKGYICYDSSGDLDDTVTDIRDLIVRCPLATYMYLNGTKGTVEWLGDERHGRVMSGQTHLEIHQNRGFFVAKGMDIHGVVNNGTTWTGMDSGNCGDEDIKMAFAAITEAPKLYMEGAANEWTFTDSDNKFGIFRDGKCCYNDISGVPQLSEINSDRVVMQMMAGNNKIHPRAWLVGQELHTTRSLARIFGPSDFDRIKTAGLPSAEAKQIGSVIVNSESTGTAEVGADDEIWYDHRKADSTPRKEGDND